MIHQTDIFLESYEYKISFGLYFMKISLEMANLLKILQHSVTNRVKVFLYALNDKCFFLCSKVSLLKMTIAN